MNRQKFPLTPHDNPLARTSLGLFFALLMMAAPAWSRTSWPIHQSSDLPPSSKATYGRLDNGFRYLILGNPEPPERVSLRLLVQAGSLMETEEQRGLAHFVEHMAFNGTENFAADEMVAYFQRLGMAFGPDTNAHTGFNETVYYLELPEPRTSLLRDGLLLLSDYADRMLFPEPELERERGVILAEKRDRDSADYRTFVGEIEFIAAGTRLARRFPIGLEEVIKQAPRRQFIDFYQKWYTPDRMVLVAVGDIEPEELEPLIAEYFSSLPPAEPGIEEPDPGKIEQRGMEARLHREAEASTIRISIQAARQSRAKTDTAELRSRELLLDLANQIITRRLELLSRQPEIPFTRGAAYSRDWFDLIDNPLVVVTARSEQWTEALARLEQELRRALTYGFTQNEIDEASTRLLHQAERAVRRQASRNSRQLATAITRTVSQNRVWTEPETNLELTRATLEKAGPEQVHQRLRESWPADQRLIFVSGNLPDQASEKKIYQTMARSLLKQVEPPIEDELAEFAYTDFGEPGRISRRQYHQDLEITEVEFENHVTLLIKPTEFEEDVIHVGLRFGDGRLTLPETQAGLALLAENGFIEGGLEAHGKDQLDRIFAGREINLSFAVNDDCFILTGQTSPEDFTTQFKLMAAYLQNPGYREQALHLADYVFDRLYTQLRHTVQGVIQDRVNRFIAGGDHRFGMPPRAQLDKLQMADLRAWLQPALQTAPLTIAVVGDLDVEKVVTGASRVFAAMPARQADEPQLEAARQIDFPPTRKSKEFHFSTEIPRAAALVFWPTEDMRDISRTRRLGFLGEVVSDRLRIQVREEMGQAYSPRASHRASHTYNDFGYLRALVQCEREQASEIADTIIDIGRELVEKGIDEDEHQRILAPMQAGLREWVRNNQYWLHQVLLPASRYPERLDWARTMTEDIAAISRAEINQLARKYLQPENALRILILPEPQDN